MNAAATLPGLYFEPHPPVPEASPLRTDIAGFAGETRRGPVNSAVRLDGWQQFQAVFGVPAKSLDLPLAARGYFENGGDIGYVVRVLGEPAAEASATWTVGPVDASANTWLPGAPAAGQFQASEFTVAATSPGTWGNGIDVDITYLRTGWDGSPQIDIAVHCAGEPPEYLTGLPVDRLVEEVASGSRFIRLTPAKPAPPHVPDSGPLRLQWGTLTLSGGVQQPATLADYLNAAPILAQLPEVALIAYPDLHRLGDEQPQVNLIASSIANAESSIDRQVLSTLPAGLNSVPAATSWLAELRGTLGDDRVRSLTLYHPWIRVEDPSGGLDAQFRIIPPVGHIAGVISRLDRERGAYYTPSNALLFDAVDVAWGYSAPEQALLLSAGINLIRCRSGQGLQLWGGRTAAHPRRNPAGVFLAHRRLIHRLFRTIRRVADPLVFDIHDVELRLTIVRAITGVLLEAFLGGALKGTRPEDAFEVRCDESNNLPDLDESRVLCEIAVAPAVPMEFIILRVAFTTEGRLEVIES